MAKVELLYIAQNKEFFHQRYEFREGLRVSDILNQSRILETKPETQTLSFGVFSKPATLDTLLKPGDRIEIYRPLSLDPKENRRRKAKQ